MSTVRLNLKHELPHAGLVQVGVVYRSRLPCEVVGKGREKLLEDYVKHVLSELTIWQQLWYQQITAFLFALLCIQLHGLSQSLSLEDLPSDSACLTFKGLLTHRCAL